MSRVFAIDWHLPDKQPTPAVTYPQWFARFHVARAPYIQWLSTVAESDASESSVVYLVDLSDQIDAELSQEGGNICQAEGSLSVGPYNRKDISPACISRTARAETNSRAERDSRAEPRVVDMENWNDQNFWRIEKKQTESTNIKILGGPLHVLYCCCYNVSAGAWPLWLSRSVAWIQCYWLTRRIELFNIFDASFSAAFDFRGFFSGASLLCLKIDGTRCHRRQDTVTLYSKA